MSDNGCIVEIDGLCKTYFRARALNGVDLRIERGLILGLLGPNGSGKSTLLKSIAGLVRPTAGRVLIDGRPPSAATRALVAYLPEIDHLYAWMTVRETLDFVSAFYADWDAGRAAELLGAMELDAAQRVGDLSKGQRARLKLVLALARRAPLVLLDEPLSGIDPPSRARILSAIVGEYRLGEQTVILATHAVAEAEGLFDRVLFLREGRVALYGAAENLRAGHGCSIQDLWERVYA
ncbi:MAG: ABC transporter ATP-binding protein [Thermoanaerobacterales bacterium]|nr:ABC transporter ATP-binding protein [Thermoanaerobacterales bacterium]